MSRPRSESSRTAGGRRGRAPNSGDRDDAAEARIRAVLAPLVKRILDPDEASQEAVIRTVLAVCHPVVIGRVIDDLVRRAAAGKSGTAAAALAAFGYRAVPAMSVRFKRSKSEEIQVRLVGIVMRMAPGLTTSQGIDVMTELLGWLGLSAGPASRVAVGRTIAVVRAKLGSAPPPGPRSSPHGREPPAGV
ncbi:MAG: hypothetical protein JWO38_3640 [Gemmataceae bacterium]|nr:hypothetical protein [Gemmataceae bacterium]